MDFILGRNSSAYSLFLKTLSSKYFIIISDLVTREIRYQGLELEYMNMIRLLQSAHKIRIVAVENEDKRKAEEIISTLKTHHNDTLHKVLCYKYKAKYLVTNNVNDYSSFHDILVRRPDSL